MSGALPLHPLPSAEVFAFLLVFVRVGAALSILPGIAAPYVTMRIRLVVALGITLLVLPALSGTLPTLPDDPASLGLLIGGEALVGFLLGTISRIAFAAIQAAGTFVAFFGSFANAMVQDPVVEQQSSTIAGLFTTAALALIFITDLHHLMLGAITDSYGLFPAGHALPLGDASAAIARGVADAFRLALELASPFLILSLVYNVGLGMINRLMPQLQVFFFGLPFQLFLQIWVMVFTLSGIMLLFLTRFGDTLRVTFAG